MNPPAEKKVTDPYYTYGILYLSPNFRRWEASQGPRYREYRRAWARRTAQLDHGDFPLSLNVEATTRCNLACTFCSQPSLTKDQLGDMPWALFARLMDEAERHQTPAASLNGLGEPMLLARLPRMIAAAKRHGILDVMFHTNGTLMTEAIARSLIESGLDRIIFSVDSPDKKTYEEMRIHGRWERVVAHVNQFARVRSEMGRSTPLIRTTMVMTEKTILQVPDFVEMWRPVADQITLQDLTWRSKLLDGGKWENGERSAIPVSLDQVREEAIRRKVSFVCPYLYQSTVVHWNGDVVPCCHPDSRKQMVLGNLAKEELHSVWHGKNYREIRNLHSSGRWYEHPICRNCEVPLVELYKTLQKEGDTTGRDIPVASEMAPKDRTGEDFVIQYQKESPE